MIKKSTRKPFYLALLACVLLNMSAVFGQTYYSMSSADYSQNFANIANTTAWPNGFNGTESQMWRGLAVNATGTVPSALRLTTTTAIAFVTTTAAGVQRGTGNIQLLSTGSTDNTTAVAIELYLDFTGRVAGNLSFDAATVNNSTGNRAGTLRVYASINGTTYTEITGGNLPYSATNNVAGSAAVSIALPSSFDNSSTARLRFYYHNGTGGTTGSRPKISIDNLLVTSTPASTAITSTTNGDWFTGSTWVGGVVPGAGDDVTINHDVTSTAAITRNSGTSTLVNSGASLAVAATYTNDGTTTIDGTFQLNSGGWATGSDLVYGATGTLNFNNSSAYGVNNTDKFWPASAGPFHVNVLQGGLTMNATNRTVAGTFSTAAGVTLNTGSVLTLSGTCRIDAGGFFNQSPTYSGTGSTLIYNIGAGYGTFNEWTGGGSTTPAVGVGVPSNVQLTGAGTNVTLAGGRGIPGNLTINASTTFTLNAGSGDFYIGGDFTQNGTLINNSRAVQFVQSSANQLISSTSGNVFFDYLLINKPSGNVQLSGTDITINTTAGDVLQLLQPGSLDLNGRTLNFNNAGGNILSNGGSRSIVSTLAGAIININGAKTCTFGGASPALSLASTITVRLNNAGLNFGNSSTLNGVLQINAGGFIQIGGAPFYGLGSTLQYNSGGNYGRGNEWISNVSGVRGYPHHVRVSGTTNVSPGANGGQNTSWEAGGDLVVDAASGFYLDFGSEDMNQPIRFLGNLAISGGLSLSNNSGGDLKVRGNVTFSAGYSFTANGRALFFTKNGTQTISAASTPNFDYVVFEPVSGSTTVQLSGTDINILAPFTGNAITFNTASDVFDLNGRTLVLGTPGVANTVTGPGSFKGSTSSALTLRGTGSLGTLNFTTGFQTLGTLTLDRTSAQVAADLGTALAINTSLVLTNGILQLNNANLTLNASATSTGASASSFVAADGAFGTGELRKIFIAASSFSFPVGDITAADGNQYSPSTLTFSGGTFSSAYVGMQVFDAVHPNNPSATDRISRYWKMTASGITSPTYSFVGTYTSSDIEGTEANGFGGRWNGSVWAQGSSMGSLTMTLSGLTTVAGANEFTGGVFLCAAPSNASSLTLSNASSATLDLNWTNGGGAGRVVIFNSANVFTAPTSGSNPAASTTYTSGQQVVFNGTVGGPVTVNGLNPLTTYYARVYEYCSPDRVYSTGTATSSGATLALPEPSNQATFGACGSSTTTTIPLTWTDATGGQLPDGYLIKWSNSGYGSIVAPVDNTPEANGAGVQNIAQGIQSFNVTGLTNNTTYYFQMWSYTNSGANIDYQLTAPAQTFCATIPAPWEDFETGTKGGYAVASVTCTAGSWTLDDALLGTAAGDRKNGVKSARVQNVGKVQMNFDITVGGIEQFTVNHAAFGTDGSSTWQLEASTDGGSTWTAYVSSAITTSSTTLTPTSFTLSIPAPVRIRLVKLSGTGNRINFDDLSYTVYTGCTPPAGQASSLNSSNPTSTGIDLSWTPAGGSDGTLVTVRPNAAGLVAPISGTAYAANVDYALAAQINTNNRAVYRNSSSSVSGITGLTPEAFYTATAYAYASAGDCYNLSGPSSHSFWTTSIEPGGHASSFTATALAYNQIQLNFSAANLVANADGYIILQRASAAPTGLPVDATSYTLGQSVGDATVAALITNPAAVNTVISGLSQTTQYYYTLIPFNWNNTDAATYNYRTSVTIPQANATTPIQPAQLSDIITDGTYTYTSNIDYTLYQADPITNTSTSVGVWRFVIRDGGAAGSDGDGLPTILESITFSSIAGVANIRTAALFDGNTLVSNVSTVNSGAGTISFSGLSYVCSSNSTRQLTLRVSFNLSPITDNEQLSFTITNANVAAAGLSSSSLFTTFTSTVSSTTGDRNRIEVVGTQLDFAQEPSTFIQNANMTPAVTVASVDLNGNFDYDFNGTVSITSDGTLSSSPQTATASGVFGLATFSTIEHTSTGVGLQLTAQSSGQTDGLSALFNITNIASNSYRTASSGSWGSSNTATWEQFVAGTWTSSSAPLTNTAEYVYIRHTINTVGSFGNNVQMVVENGGIITNGASSTCASLLIQTGGTFQVNANLSIATGGAFEVEDGGNLIINFAFGNPSTSIFNGVENFHPESNLILQHWDSNDFLFPVTPAVTENTYSGYSAMFGNIIFDFAAGAGTMTTWTIAEAAVASIRTTHSDMIFRSADASQNTRFSTTGQLSASVGRDMIVETGYPTSALIQMKTGGGLFLTIRNDLHVSAGNFRVMAGATATSYSQLFIYGDLIVDGDANFDFNSTVTVNSVETRIQLYGDFQVTSNAQFRSTNGSGVNRGFLDFKGTGDGLTAATTQTIDCYSTQANRYTNISFSVKGGAYVQLINQNLEMNTQSTFVVENSGVFDFGFAGSTALRVVEISGGATGTSFAVLSQGTIKISHPNGIDAGTANEGNVVTDTRTFDVGATYHFIGKAPIQRMGDGMPAASSAKQVIVDLDALSTTLVFEGYNGVSYVSTGNIGLSSSGQGLLINQGTLIGSNTADFFGSGKIRMTGGLYRIQTNSATIPLLSNYSNYVLSGGTIELNAPGNQELSGTIPYFHNLSVTGANTYLTDSKTISSSIVVNNNVSITGSAVFDISNKGMSGDAGLSMDNGRLRMSKLNTSLPELNGIATPYNLTGGVIEWYGTTSIQQQLIRGGVSYYNMEINSSAANLSIPASAGNVDAASSFSLTGTLNVFSPSVLRLDASDAISGTGNLTIQAGAGLIYGSADGIKLTGTSASDGNIRISGVRTLPSSANYGFVGATDMTVGNGLPSSVEGFYMLKSNATAQVAMLSDIEVTGTLSLESGKIDPANHLLILGNTTTNGTLTGGSALSYVVTWKSNAANGIFRRYSNGFASYFFPIGDENFYSPVNVHLTAATATSNPYLDAFVTALPHPNLGTATSYLNRYWTIEPDGITNPTYNVDLSYDAGDVVGVETTLFPFKWNIAGWVGAGGSPASAFMGTGSVNTGAKTLNWSGLSTFSEFTGIGDGSPLPIELLSFTAKPHADYVQLDWVTASEINNAFFTVERSLDLVQVFEVAQVDGAINSNWTNYYNAKDSNPKEGLSYYRLVQTDLNGQTTSSDWVAVDYKSQHTAINYVYANQSDAQLFISISGLNSDADIEVVDLSGRTLMRKQVSIDKSSSQQMIPMDQIAAGIYFLRIHVGQEQIVQRFVW